MLKLQLTFSHFHSITSSSLSLFSLLTTTSFSLLIPILPVLSRYACCVLPAWLQREWSREQRPVQGSALTAELCWGTHTLEESRGEVRRERVPLQGGYENMIIWVMGNVWYLGFYLVLWGLLHDVLVRLAGFNNSHRKPNALGDRGQFSDCMYF